MQNDEKISFLFLTYSNVEEYTLFKENIKLMNNSYLFRLIDEMISEVENTLIANTSNHDILREGDMTINELLVYRKHIQNGEFGESESISLADLVLYYVINKATDKVWFFKPKYTPDNEVQKYLIDNNYIDIFIQDNLFSDRALFADTQENIYLAIDLQHIQALEKQLSVNTTQSFIDFKEKIYHSVNQSVYLIGSITKKNSLYTRTLVYYKTEFGKMKEILDSLKNELDMGKIK